jgi:hypothetical protein
MKTRFAYFALMTLILLGSTTRAVRAEIVFLDTFDDGVVASRYTTLGGGTISEASGVMTVNMLDAGDGVRIDLSDIGTEFRCLIFDYNASGFTLDEGLVVETFAKDGSGGELLAFRTTFVQTNSEDVTVEVFDEMGNVIQTRMFTVEDANVDGDFFYRLDILPDCTWMFEATRSKGVNAGDKVVTALMDFPDSAMFAKTLGASSIRVKSRSDGVVSFDTLTVDNLHVPEPASLAMAGTAALLGLVALRRRMKAGA